MQRDKYTYLHLERYISEITYCVSTGTIMVFTHSLTYTDFFYLLHAARGAAVYDLECHPIAS